MAARKLKQVDHVTTGKIDAQRCRSIMTHLLPIGSYLYYISILNNYLFLSTYFLYSEPERLSHYRNSVAYLDEEVEALLAKRKHSSTVM